MKTIGFIGCGNMGKAMVEGIMKAQYVDGEHMIVSNLHPEKLQKLSERYDFYISDNESVARNSDILFLAVKPYMFQKVIDEIKDFIKEDVIIISIAAGITMDELESMFESPCKIVRAMPNTPAMVQEAMSAVVFNHLLSNQEKEEITAIFECFGECLEVKEELMSGVIAISGSSPAYFFMMIEAMADEAVLEGMTRDDAYHFAAQAMLGSAKLVLESKMHPAQLKDMVTSPRGTTIEAVLKLEEYGFRNAIMQAMKACADKNRRM